MPHTFAMSMFRNKEDLYKSKVGYYESFILELKDTVEDSLVVARQARDWNLVDRLYSVKRAIDEIGEKQ